MPCVRKVLFLTYVFFSIASGLSAQSPDFAIEEQFFASPEVVYLSDFNITQSGSNTLLFRVTLRNLTPEVKKVILTFKLTSQRYANTPIVEAVSEPFDLSPNNPISITNLDITNNTLPDIRFGPVHYNQQIADEINEAIKKTGRLPNDVYIITLLLAEVQNPSNNRKLEHALSITNPTRIDLVGPGHLATSGDCPQVFTNQPQFQWQSNANKFILTVCEELPTNSSPEDVMQNEPRAQLTLQRGRDFFGSPSLVYPAVFPGARVWPLEGGKTYYWQVKAVIQSPSEEILLPSEIWCFRVAKLDDIGRQIMHKSVMIALKNILAGTPFSDVLDPNGPLKGFTITGVIYLNGRRINVSNINALISKFTSGNAKIINISIE